jgi:Zn-finger nucleic acid-binding protein
MENMNMICPVCRTVELRIADKQGVEIDYCPQCRGVWLDRGELEKIMQRESAYVGGYESRPAAPASPDPRKRKTDGLDVDLDLDLEMDVRDRRQGGNPPPAPAQRYDDDDDDYRYRQQQQQQRQSGKKKGFLGELFDIFD